MPVDLRTLPQELVPPPSPRHARWCVMLLFSALLVSGLVVLLWPQSQWRMSLWFWCCAVVLPFVPGLIVYAVRLLAHERQSDYVESWNDRRADQEQKLIAQGQRAVALIATAYCSAAGNNLIALALRRGSQALQPVYLKSLGSTLRMSQLTPPAQDSTQEEYARRLNGYLQQVLTNVNADLQDIGCSQPLSVRIRHNQVLNDDEVLALWSSAWPGSDTDHPVSFATQDDGLMWLDTWLDDPPQHGLLLSLEINLFQEPFAEQAESVSAVLLAAPDHSAVHKAPALAWIHRPVAMADPALAVQDALLWGGLSPGHMAPFIWFTQVPNGVSRDVRSALSVGGYPCDAGRCHVLDTSFGLPGCAVGNVALLIAGEQASSDRQAQAVMLQDVSAQMFVVQPA